MGKHQPFEPACPTVVPKFKSQRTSVSGTMATMKVSQVPRLGGAGQRRDLLVFGTYGKMVVLVESEP